MNLSTHAPTLTAQPHIPFPATGSYPVRAGNAVRPLIDGVPAFRRICASVAAARHSVWITPTLVAPDFQMPDGHGSFFDVLDRAAARGSMCACCSGAPTRNPANTARPSRAPRPITPCCASAARASAPALDTTTACAPTPAIPELTGIAEDLEAAWKNTSVTMRSRQQLARALVNDITVDIDEQAREIVLLIHWKGGQHSELRLRKPRTGEHECSTSDEALAVIRSMASRWSDQDIAATLNRMGLPTGQGKTWTAHRVSSIRRVRGIHAYKSAEKDGTWLTLREAAQRCGVTSSLSEWIVGSNGRHRSRLRRLATAGVT
ncbi:MAG TPA: hypothetical protein VGH36_08415 [Acetobacteraceae bacterium]|jgi:hypothetical protein